MVPELSENDEVIGIVGLGYVGWPLLKEFEKYFKVIGFEVNREKIDRLQNQTETAEVTMDETRPSVLLCGGL